MISPPCDEMPIRLGSPEMDYLEQVIETHTPEETREIAETIGKSLAPGAILLLYGDLGSGKTAFIQGLGRGLDVPAEHYITSPTYTLIHQYPARYPFFHVDLYRLQDVEEIEDIGLIELFTPRHVVAIEWADRLAGEALLEEYLAIHLTILNETTRKIRLIAYGLKWSDLLKSTGFTSRTHTPISLQTS
jgi:tRNA threonylcarbamoyladenosine biosynthesis protein TsaE